MNAVAKVETPTATQAIALIDAIERAATNPAVDVDKMERLLQMQERIVERQAKADFNGAMSDAQGEMTAIARDASNPQTKSKYATYDRLDYVLRPIYVKNGFSISYDTADSPKEEHVRVVAVVGHRGGFTREYHVDMPADGKGAKGGDVMTKTHAVGAAFSYGKRYLLKGIFNVAEGEGDRDGNDQREPLITTKQAADLRALLDEHNANEGALCRAIKVDRIEDIWARHFDHVCSEVRARKSK